MECKLTADNLEFVKCAMEEGASDEKRMAMDLLEKMIEQINDARVMVMYLIEETA